MAEGSKLAKSLRSPFQWIVVGLIGLFLALVTILPAITGRLESPKASPMLQNAHAIGLCMFQYALDHNGVYPDGKSSTEVFQKLVDEQYITDPVVFYVRMPGKTRATSDKLKPENVSWDITIPADSKSPDGLPLVFLTGYKVAYTPRASAIPLFKSNGDRLSGIAVCYKSNSAQFMKNGELPNGAIANFIPADFDPAGKKFQQLTPEGILPSN
jgi:hypothetical protein